MTPIDLILWSAALLIAVMALFAGAFLVALLAFVVRGDGDDG